MPTDQETAILHWMQVFDVWNSSLRRVRTLKQYASWRPKGEKEEEAFRNLTSPEVRPALKTWYSKRDAINSHANQFRRVLERAVGESLPLAAAAPQKSRLPASDRQPLGRRSRPTTAAASRKSPRRTQATKKLLTRLPPHRASENVP